MSGYAKFFAALLTSILTLVSQAFGVRLDISPEIITAIGGAVTTLLVFIVPNFDAKAAGAAAKVDAILDTVQRLAGELPRADG